MELEGKGTEEMLAKDTKCQIGASSKDIVYKMATSW
jgi:hypothetical protein